MAQRTISSLFLCGFVSLAIGCNDKAAPAKPAETNGSTAGAENAAALAKEGHENTAARTNSGSAESESAASATAADTHASDDSAEQKAPAKPTGPENLAVEFVDALAAGQFDDATRDFDETMTKDMPPAKLKQAWSSIEAQAGKFKKRRAIRTEKTKAKDASYDIVFVTCDFEKSAIDVKVVYTSDAKVTGLFFVPAKPAFVGKEELWLGELDAGGAKLRLLLRIGKTADGKHQATLDSLDQGQKGIPFDSVTYENGKVRLEAKALQVVYEGTIDESGKELSGEWRQGGASLPLTFKQVESEPQASRPQTPKRPFPYDEIEVAYENKPAGVKLAGTLTVPRGEALHPAAILITGSGAQDRDETIFNHKPFLVLADYLTRRGIAVLRADDRGIGGSTTSAEAATTADLAEDVRSAIDFLKSRSEIDGTKIGLIGHSEGGTIAPLVASQSSDVAFIVMLAGSVVTGEEVLYQQAAALLKAGGASEKVLAAQRELQSRIFAIVKATPDAEQAVEKINSGVAEFIDSLDEETRAGLGEVKAAAAAQAPRVAGKWFRFMLTYDPRPSLEKTHCPVLALNGANDLQVLPEENLSIIREALTAGGNADFETHELANLNHLFQTSRTGQVAEYAQIEETIAPAALELIANWILRHVDTGRN